jgi:uncharacterized ion transporter superfamily protein YfcC
MVFLFLHSLFFYRYRKKIKEDPVLLKLHQEKEKTRKKLYRLKMSDKAKEHEREMNKIRQARYVNSADNICTWKKIQHLG